MNKISIAAVAAAVTMFGYADTVTNAVDVYDMKVTMRTPVVKVANAGRPSAYVYRDTESRVLKGTLTLTWVSEEGDDFDTVIPSLSLYDKKLGKDSTVDYDIVGEEEATRGATPFDFSILGKKMNKASAIFVGVDKDVDEETPGYKFLEFAGFGSTKALKTKKTVEACGPCGISVTTSGKCQKIHSLSGSVTGMYSCGCATNSPSLMAQSCGYVDTDDGATPLISCDGKWTAKFNKRLSH